MSPAESCRREPFADLPGPGPAREKFGIVSDEPIVLFLSRLHYKKGVERLIEAAELMQRDNVPCRFLIAGTDLEQGAYERKLKDMTTSRGLDDRVSFLGFVDGLDKISLYQAADLFILPTSQENFGFVLFEALAASTPVLTTRGADTWPELEASGGSLIIDAKPLTIVRAIQELMADPRRRHMMGESGRAWVFKNLSGAAVIRQYEDLYEAARDTRPNR